MRRVEVVPYDTMWKKRYEHEAALFTQLFGSDLVAMYHIGSTAVDGLSAKPIIDVMPIVREIERVDTYAERIRALGYEVMGEHGIPRRRYLRKGGDDRTVHVHIFEQGSEHQIRHLAFRDYLRTFPEARIAYGELKEQLAEMYPNDIERYIAGKHEFVVETERLAKKWYEERNQHDDDSV